MDKYNPFERLLGNTAELRLLEIILSVPDTALTSLELSEFAEISDRRTNEIIEKYLKWNILIEPTPAEYMLNKESSIIQCFQEFNNILIDNIVIDKMMEIQNGQIR
jgi:hypothetical protein